METITARFRVDGTSFDSIKCIGPDGTREEICKRWELAAAFTGCTWFIIHA